MNKEGLGYFVAYAYLAALELVMTYPWTAVILVVLVYGSVFVLLHYCSSYVLRIRALAAALASLVLLGLAPLLVMAIVAVATLIKGYLHRS